MEIQVAPPGELFSRTLARLSPAVFPQQLTSHEISERFFSFSEQKVSLSAGSFSASHGRRRVRVVAAI